MKQHFSGFYTPTEDEFKKIWTSGTFVFDANVLLNPYRFQTIAREVLLKAFSAVKDRIWIPYQVGLEYHFNMYEEIIKQKKAYEKLENKLLKKVVELEDDYREHSARHAHLKLPEHLHKKYKDLIDEIVEDLNKQKTQHPDLNKVKESMLTIFNSKIGNPLSKDKLEKIYTEGEERYPNKVPPGWRDTSQKKGQTKYYNGIRYQDEYGDLVMWKQIIEYANDEKVDVLLISDDNKEDWIKKEDGETIGPQPELIQEFQRETNGRQIYICNTRQFLNNILTYINIEDVTADDIKTAIESINQYIKKEEIEKEERESSFEDFKILDKVKFKEYLNRENKTFDEPFKMYLKLRNQQKMIDNSISFSNIEDNTIDYKLRVLCEKTNFRRIRKSIFKVHDLLYGSQPKYVRSIVEPIHVTAELYSHYLVIRTGKVIDEEFIKFLKLELDNQKIEADIEIAGWQKSV
ncbi:PIN-like domain-containing protein [Bacillus velezensis]|uniref:PIN-like domain-containing protein n=1 Tax=Bacillus velezensis TaxID=492670 RepID=UPI00255BB12F|nr:PIN-like domain-containing protein [Bacillus velezensis]MDL5022660.1 PIN domain-containing protein [Bacillus velezensis]